MSRLVYRSLLRLHPDAFRQRFGAEMLCIYDEAAAGGTTLVLLTDVVISLLRQWIVRSGCWKAAVALVGAFLQISVGGFSFFLFSIRPGHARAPISVPVAVISPAAAELIQLMLWTSGTLIVLVILTTLWVRNFTRRVEGR
jgi:hypothetical protein